VLDLDMQYHGTTRRTVLTADKFGVDEHINCKPLYLDWNMCTRPSVSRWSILLWAIKGNWWL